MTLAPAALAAMIMDELADSTGTGLVAHTRLHKGAEPATLMETARLLVAACPGADRPDGPSSGSLPPGVLAFAAVAAHTSGDEAPLQVAEDVLFYTHPVEAAEMVRRYLLGHPGSRELFTIFAQPSVRAELAEAGWSGLDEFDGADGLGDPSDPGFAQRLSERALQAWEPDPQVQTWYQGRAGIAIEFRRRQRMHPGEQNASAGADK